MISADPSIKQFLVEMRYKPERALTHIRHMLSQSIFDEVEMRYKPVSKTLMLVTIK